MLPSWTLCVLLFSTFVRLHDCGPSREKRTADLMYSHYGPATHCDVGDQLISHGEVFVDPSMSRCLLHQCVYGSSYIISEGCEGGDDICHDVGEVWQERCITYTCTKTTIGGYNYFQPIVQHARCWDVYGQCHEPGDLFTYRLHGRLHNACRCNITDNKILYHCY